MKSHPFSQKILLNYSLYWCHFMFYCTQTWLFPFFSTFMIVPIHIFLICNKCAMIFSPETELFLEILIFHRQTCFIGNLFVKPTTIWLPNQLFFIYAWIFHINTNQNSKIPIFSSKSRTCLPFSIDFGNLYIFFYSCSIIFVRMGKFI